MKTLILSAIAASALFASGASAQSHHYGGGYGGSYYGGGYARSHAAPGPYYDVGSYDSYAGHRGGYRHAYRVRPATVRRSYGYSRAPRYASHSIAPLRTLGTSYVSPPYTLPEYDYQYPAYSGGSTYSRPYAVPSSYGYGGGSYGTVNTVPYSQPHTGSYDYRCGC